MQGELFGITHPVDQRWPDFAEIGTAVPKLTDAVCLALRVHRLSPDFGEVGPQLAFTLFARSGLQRSQSTSVRSWSSFETPWKNTDLKQSRGSEDIQSGGNAENTARPLTATNSENQKSGLTQSHHVEEGHEEGQYTRCWKVGFVTH